MAQAGRFRLSAPAPHSTDCTRPARGGGWAGGLKRLALVAALAAAATWLALPARADQATHPSTPSEAQVHGPAGPLAPATASPLAPDRPGTPNPGPRTPSLAPASPQGAAPAAPQKPSLDALFRAGMRARKQGHTDEALRDFQGVLKLAPYHFRAHVELGLLYLPSQPALAVQHLETAARLQPSSADVHSLLGRAYEAVGRLLDAAEQFRRAIYLDPRDYAADAHLRDVLKRLRAKRTPVQRAAAVFYEQPSLVRLTLFGRIVMRQDDPRQAVLEFEEVAQRVPNLPEVQLWIARARRAAGDLAGEVAAYRTFLRKRPQADGVRLLVVQRLMEQGWYDEAGGLLAPLLATGQAQGAGAEPLSPDARARVTFLHSRLLSAQQHPNQAGALLVDAAQQGYAADQIGTAFSQDLALHPDAGALWLDYGRWLSGTHKPAQAAAALAKAGLLDPTQRPQARVLLESLRDQGAAPEATALALGQVEWASGDGQAALASLAKVPLTSALDHRAALLRGLIYRDQGKVDAALDAFLHYVLFFSDPAEQLYARGNVFWQTGHRQEALALWQQHPQVLLKHPDVLQHVAQQQEQAGDSAAELATRQRLAQVQPANAPNRIRLGELYALQGQRLKAVQLWEQVLQQRPRDASLLLRVGKTWIALGQPAKGLPRLQQAAALGALDPADSATLAAELYRSHQYEAALRTYWALYQSQPTQPDLPTVLPELVLSVHATHAQRAAAAQLALKAGRLDAAAQVLQTIVDTHPEDLNARMTLAEVYLRQNQAARAQAVLVAPGAAGASDEQGLRLLATVQERLGRRAALNDTLARLQKLHPDDTALRRKRALLLVSLHRYVAAKPMLEAAVADSPHDLQLQLALAHTALALREQAEAEQHFEAALRIDPTQADALRRLIQLLLAEQRWTDVVPRLEAWIKLHPRDATALYNLISAQLRLARKDDARPHFNALRKLSPQRAASLAPYFD